ncbi:hypothetical protein HNP46_000474 [Pseudomonas nitritireducens]|uniref:Uncharacterized protein n=1 Tax=Pseudomonas nitroreducens TaxID=46680 RepID=A0A7W7KGI0_PSENT|nr:hypothetical protein [Pseudomonas nitritireducens]MBB4861663.1 hypothetical protein [Pseudomonas nitritireducens]
MNLCSACAPPMLKNGELTMYGDWHGMFERKFLPKGMFRANGRGLLVHIITGEDYRKYVVPPPDQEKD